MLNKYARTLVYMAGYLPNAKNKTWYENMIAKTSEWLWETK